MAKSAYWNMNDLQIPSEYPLHSKSEKEIFYHLSAFFDF